jgi:hypothetical protein
MTARSTMPPPVKGLLEQYEQSLDATFPTTSGCAQENSLPCCRWAAARQSLEQLSAQPMAVYSALAPCMALLAPQPPFPPEEGGIGRIFRDLTVPPPSGNTAALGCV